jgi:tetratricopeptide (TPR) repeat protein
MNTTNQNTDGASDATGPPRVERYFIKSPSIRVLLVVLIFLALGFFIYFNTLESPFVFDDMPRILENRAIRLDELTLKGLMNAAFGKQSARSRPIGNITFALNYYVHQYELAGYHIVNIIIHIASGILLWLILTNTLNLKSVRPEFEHGPWIALLAALLWLVNPAQTQTVTYIVQRLNGLAAMFSLFSFLFYLKGRLTLKPKIRWVWFLGAALGWLLALGCKQNAATLPFFILLYEWYFFQDLDLGWFRKNIKYIIIVVVVFVLVAVIFLGTKPIEKLASINDYANKEFTIAQRVMTEFRVVLYYLSLIFYPQPSRLNLDYDFPLSYSLIDPLTTLPALICIAGLIALAVYLAKKQRLISFCIFWFLGNLVIESSVIPVAIIFEHRIYTPSMFVCLIPVILLYRYIKPVWLVAGIGCALILLFSYWTIERNRVWRDALTLWADSVEKSPNKARPYSNLGVAQKSQNMVDEAAVNFRKALQLNPDYTEAHHNLAVILKEQDKTSEAVAHYRKAIEIDPTYVKSYNNLGLILLKDRTDEAIALFVKALQIRPDFSQAHNNLGLALSKQGKYSEAIDHYIKALALEPNNAKAHLNLGDALLMQGKTGEAINHIRKSLQIDPEYAEAHNNLGGQLLNQGRLDEALEHFNRALSINPDLAEAHNNVGIILIQRGKLNEAISHFQSAVRINPEFSKANNNLRRALAIRDSRSSENDILQKALEERPDDPELHFKMGNVYLGKRELNQAVVEFEKALDLRPDFLQAQNNLAMAYAADRQYDRALAAFKKLIELDPDNASTFYNIAVLYALKNSVPESIAWLKKAVDKGYRNWELIKTDRDLVNIRNSEAYRELVKGH